MTHREMMPSPSPQVPGDLADRLDSALRALWRGSSHELEELIGLESSERLPVTPVYEQALQRRDVPVIGLGNLSEVPGYRIVREIGRGGMGVVYEAEQQHPRRRVALKVLGGLYTDEAHVRLFRQEIQSLALLKHPSIATIYEAGVTVEGYHFFTMELVHGQSLSEYAQRMELSREEILELFLKICQAIEYAHDSGIIHRDLKPSNIIIDSQGNPKILDFGLARTIDVDVTLTASITRTDRIMGTLAYMSPEQARGDSQHVDRRGDVYSLGMILYELLTGRLPYTFEKVPPYEAVRRICEGPPPKPGTLDRTLRGDLETILLKSLVKEPSERYASVAALAADVRHYLNDEPIVARPPSWWYVARKRLIRHRVAALITGSMFILALLGAWGAWQRHEKDRFELRRRVLKIQNELEAGRVSTGLGMAEAEYAEYPAVLDIDLVHRQALFRAARIAGNERAVDEVVGGLRDQLTRTPGQWAYRALLNEFYRVRGDTRTVQQQALAQSDVPETAENWYLRTFTTLDAAEARRFAWLAAKTKPTHVLAWERLAHLCWLAHDYEGAAEAANQLIALGMQRGEWMMFLGHILLQQGKYTEALEQYDRAAVEKPLSAELYNARALVHLCLRDYKSAVADYSRAAELYGPTQDHQSYQRATPLWILGRRQEAAANYRSALNRRVRVTYADARLFLVLHEEGRVLLAEGRTEEADALFRQARHNLAQALQDVEQGSWLESILACLSGAITPEELIQQADPNRAEERCEAYYYAGETCLTNWEDERAAHWFQECVNTHMIFDPHHETIGPMNEYHLALWRLDAGRSEQNIAGGNSNPAHDAIPLDD